MRIVLRKTKKVWLFLPLNLLQSYVECIEILLVCRNISRYIDTTVWINIPRHMVLCMCSCILRHLGAIDKLLEVCVYTVMPPDL